MSEDLSNTGIAHVYAPIPRPAIIAVGGVGNAAADGQDFFFAICVGHCNGDQRRFKPHIRQMLRHLAHIPGDHIFHSDRGGRLHQISAQAVIDIMQLTIQLQKQRIVLAAQGVGFSIPWGNGDAGQFGCIIHLQGLKFQFHFRLGIQIVLRLGQKLRDHQCCRQCQCRQQQPKRQPLHRQGLFLISLLRMLHSNAPLSVRFQRFRRGSRMISAAARHISGRAMISAMPSP